MHSRSLEILDISAIFVVNYYQSVSPNAMKLFLFLILSIVVSTTALKGQNSCLVAKYNFTGNALDSVGNNHGTVYNATLTSDRFGKANSAYSFSSSSSSYIQLPYSNFFTPNYTYALWVKITTIPNSSSFSVPMSIGGNGGDQNMQLFNSANGGSLGTLTGLGLTAYQKAGSTISAGGVATGSLPSTNTWYHFAVTRDSNFYRLYVNGCLVATSSNTNGALPFYGNNTFDARIGCRERGGWYFDGVLDDVHIYSCALTSAEVSKLYNNLKPLVITKDTTICKDDFQAFKLKVPRTYCTYRWVDMSSPNSILSTDSQLLVNITTTKTFRCVTNSKDTAYATVRIIPRPKLNLGNDTFYCGNVLRTLDAGSKALTYKWDDNSTSRYRQVSDSGYFHVLYTDSFGCKAHDTIHLGVHPLPEFDLGVDTHYCNNFSRSLIAYPNAKKYDWNTSDTTSSITISSKGLYWVEVEDSNACIFKDSITVSNPRVAAGFLMSVLDSCSKSNNYFFKDSSSLIDNIKMRNEFHFGDNTMVAADSAFKHYQLSGSYTVKQVVYSDEGCRDSVSKQVQVWPNPKAGFNINDSLQCFNGQDFDFTGNSSVSSGNMTYDWHLGDGGTTTSIDVDSKTYTIDSTYEVKLFVTTDKSCRDTISKYLSVYPNAQLSFTIENDSQCFNGHSVNIYNESEIRNGSLIASIWHYSDLSRDTSLHVSNRRFNIPDEYTVMLETLSDKGCRDSVQKSFDILDNTEVNFQISKDTQCFKWNSFSFVNTSLLDKGTFSNAWDFGDGVTDTTRTVKAKRFNLYGNYDVMLETMTDKGCKDTIIKRVVVHASPVDSFEIDDDRQCFRGNVFNFTNRTMVPEGNIVQRTWLLGDGSVYTIQDVTNHSYQSEDSFDVSLSSVTDKGCKDTFSAMAVTFAQPIAQFVVPNDSQCWQKHYFNIENQTVIKYGNISNHWDFGDNTTDTSYTPGTKKYANKSASYTVRYVATSEHGCQDSMKHDIQLLERPIADFIINDSIQCFGSHNFTFTNQTSFSAMNTVSYYWDYGNGDTSMGYNPKSAMYLTPVYHDVRLIAYSYLTNCYDTTVYKVLPAPHSVPDFDVNQDSQCLRTNQFVFTNNSSLTLGSMRYVWHFDDGDTDTATNPSKSYLSGFIRNVKLLAITNNGCVDSITRPIVIIPHPVASFTVNDTAQCLNKQAFNLSNGTTLAYGTYVSKWLFDDGSEATSKDYSGKSFANPGSHTIKLAVSSQQDCRDTFSRMVFLERDKNTVPIQLNADSQCLKGNSFNFNVQSNNPDVVFNSYKWLFGDGNSSVMKSVKHTYSSPGNKTVLLETISANGCLDSGYLDLRVHPQAVLDFEVNSPCDPDSVNVLNKSAVSSGDIVLYEYTFSDGFKSNNNSPAHKFSAPGSYDVVLHTVTDKGCKDTLSKLNAAVVRRKPQADFTQERIPDKQFDVATIKFSNNSSSDVTAFNWDFGNGNSSTEENPEADFNDTFRRLVTLIVTNGESCTDTISKMTGSLVSDFVFYFPDAFSPGQDGVNDVLKPVMTPYVRKYVMEVYNRWGELVFYSDDLSKGWDGKYQGEDCEQGVYLCRIYLVPMRGAIRSLNLSVTLLR